MASSPSDYLKGTTKLLYGVSDVGNAVVNAAVQFFRAGSVLVDVVSYYTANARRGAGAAGGTVKRSQDDAVAIRQ